ncbi:MAG: CBS domain-containing protein [Halobacteriaceae archaeon]
MVEDISVARLMTTSLETVSPDTLVEDAAHQMLEQNIGSLMVVDEENHLEGILTTTDFVRIVAERKPKDDTPVAEYMTTDVITAMAQDNIEDVANIMVENGIHHMPVVDKEEGVIGIITTTDLTGYVSTGQTQHPKSVNE